jgi:hypothetical protein
MQIRKSTDIPKKGKVGKEDHSENATIPSVRKKREGGPIIHKNGTTIGAMIGGVGG